MAIQIQYRYGTTTEHATFTGAASEITVETTKKTLVVHDGTTAGGFPLAREDGSNAKVVTGATASVAGAKGVVPAPAAGDQGKVLYGDGTWKTLPTLTVGTDATTARTLALTDIDNYVRFTNAGAKTLTVPLNSAVAFPIGTTFSGISVGGQLTIAGTAGVTINTPETLKLRNKSNVSFMLTKVATDTWDLAGDLEAA